MRRTLFLLLGASLLATGLGCSRTLQHTAGVCDCCPAPVESVLTPYAHTALPAPPSPIPAPGVALTPTAVMAPH